MCLCLSSSLSLGTFSYFYVGKSHDVSYPNVNGYVKDFRVYDKALTYVTPA